ncbi:hypothetical protein F5Y08DRAFT_351490 [Xylaria arbuscula]|nr:hypothetical protein F5Y08DRAFT_351490 [Xylaria arbuscula]
MDLANTTLTAATAAMGSAIIARRRVLNSRETMTKSRWCRRIAMLVDIYNRELGEGEERIAFRGESMIRAEKHLGNQGFNPTNTVRPDVNINIPTYTVVLPRPLKPPLLLRISHNIHHHNSNNYCVTIISIQQDNVPSRTESPRTFAFMACTKRTTTEHRSHHTLAMTPDFNVVSPTPWLGDFTFQPVHEFQADLMSLTQTPFNIFAESQVLTDFLTLQPDHPETCSTKKRGLNNIGEPDEGCFHRTSNTQENTPRPSDSSTAAPESRSFACPFLKRPGKETLSEQERKYCVGPRPGWKIHRLKEHLYRKHASTTYQCHHCLVEFEDASGLFEHERSPEPCVKKTSNASDIEKIYAQEVNELKRKTRYRSDEDKWRDIYRIVFRLGPNADFPSPYYEDITKASHPTPESHSADDSLSQFQSYLRDRLQGPLKTSKQRSTIQACMDLVQEFRQQTETPSSTTSTEPSPISNKRGSSTTTPSDQPSNLATSLTQDRGAKSLSEILNLDVSPFEGLQTWHESFELELDPIIFGTAVLDIPPRS